MRTSLVVVALVLSALCVVSATGVLDAGSDIEWIQPSFIEAEMELPGVGGACGVGGRCVALNAACAAGSSIVWSQCAAGVAKCCVPAKAATPVTPVPASAAAGGSIAVFAGGPLTSAPRNIVIPANIAAIGAQYTRAPKKGPVSNACPKTAPIMSDALLTQILTGLWSAFGANSAQASSYAALNLKQIHRESTGCPNVIQSIVDVNSKTDPAGGLVQFTSATFAIWHVKGTVNSRFNPVSNLAAAINAQVNGHRMTACHTHRVLNGCSGWSPDSDKTHNPYAD